MRKMKRKRVVKSPVKSKKGTENTISLSGRISRKGQVTKSANQGMATSIAKRRTTRIHSKPLKEKFITLKSEMTARDESKTIRCEVRLTERQQRSIEQAASILGFKNPTEYIRYTIQANALKVIKDQSILEIAERHRERFMREMTNPSKPGDALKNAVKHFENFFEGK